MNHSFADIVINFCWWWHYAAPADDAPKEF
jgi:hypothetical protein